MHSSFQLLYFSSPIGFLLHFLCVEVLSEFVEHPFEQVFEFFIRQITYLRFIGVFF